MSRRPLTPEEKLERHARQQSDRTIESTPEIKRFLARADVIEIPFPSGGVWVFIGPTRGFYGTNRLEAAEPAMKAAMQDPSRNTT